jgi:type IV pilus assembly protein PilC
VPDFLYRAVDRHGQATDGTMIADNELKLEAQLRAIGYWLIEAKPYMQRRSAMRSKVSRTELADFYHGMASLLSAGISISEAFKAMGEEIENHALRHIIEDVEVNIQAGNEISTVLRHYPEVFPNETCNIVRAGEHGGNLPDTFTELAKHTEWVERIVGDIKQATIYPAMVLTAVVGLIALLFVFVIPRFATIFEGLDMTLPLITRIVLNLGNAAADLWWMFILLFAGLAAGATLGPKHSDTVRRFFDRNKLRLPIFGPVNRLLVQSQLTHNLSLLLRAGVPILDSLRLCHDLVGNTVMQDAIKAAEIAVSEGRRASDALRGHHVISSLTLRMFVLGEETGNLEDSLQHVTKRFDEEIPRRVKKVFAVLEPTITILLVFVVGFVAASLFLPMFNLVGGIGR